VSDERPLPLSWGPLLQTHPLAHFVYEIGSLRLLAANAPALARYGYSREAFLKLTRLDLLVPGDAPLLRQFLAALPASANAAVQHVWKERTRDGRVLFADVRGMTVLFEGRPARLCAVVDAGYRAQLEADAAVARDLQAAAGRMAQLGGWALDLRTRRMRWSDVVCAIHEVPAGSEYDIEGAASFYPGAAAATIGDVVRRCAIEGTPFDVELPLVTAAGNPRWVRNVGAAVRDAHGRIVAIDGAQQDITQRKLDALALDESRQRLAALVHALPDLWFLVDAQLRYAEVSREDHPALAAPWPTMRGQLLGQWLSDGHAATLRQKVAQAHQSGQPQRYQYTLTTWLGDMRSFECRCVPMPDGRTLLLVRDFTEAVALERRFRAMADAAPVAIYMTDALGQCTYTNPAWQALYGLPFEDALGEGWATRLHPEDRGRVQGSLPRLTIAPGLPDGAWEMEFRIQTPQRGLLTVQASSRPVRHPDGSVQGHVGTVVDMTQARELEAARQAQAVAEEAGRRQAIFMSRMSHELRTPLNAILGFGQLLQQGAALPPQRAQSYAGHVVQAGQHMLALVDDLLKLQRLEQGRLPVHKTPLDVAQQLAACVDLLGPAASAAGVELQVLAPAGLVLHSDERCLRQIMLNLASNAIKYGRKSQGSQQVVLSAEVTPQAVLLHVVDHGEGMTPEQLQRLFRPFERLGQEAGSQPGSGLGLVITRQLAQLLGGEVTLHSRPGVGTKATLQLPPA
jgi:PAS domain S-box-containing protein